MAKFPVDALKMGNLQVVHEQSRPAHDMVRMAVNWSEFLALSYNLIHMISQGDSTLSPCDVSKSCDAVFPTTPLFFYIRKYA